MLRSLLGGGLTFSNALIYVLSSLLVIFLTLPIHEFAHGLAAVKLGDDTPRLQGRLTLNPFAHIDYMGALFILLFGFGWAKPVQVNARSFKNPKTGMAITALAGPLSNILVALVFNILLYFFSIVFTLQSAVLPYLILFCHFIVQINVSLAVFNLLPIPPLDGSRILSAVLPDRIYYRIMQYERYIYYGLLVLLFATDILDKPIYFLSNGIMNLLDLLCRLIFGRFM